MYSAGHIHVYIEKWSVEFTRRASSTCQLTFRVQVVCMYVKSTLDAEFAKVICNIVKNSGDVVGTCRCQLVKLYTPTVIVFMKYILKI